MKRRLSTILLVLILLTGLSLLLYPTVSELWNSFHQSRAVTSYAQTVSDIDDEVYEQLLEEARAYNAALAQTGIKAELTPEEAAEYDSVLAVADSGIMGYIRIPKIDVTLPVYHGTEETVLQTAVGHLEGTSLPVGGESTHCVVTGHRGLPSARLFTDIAKLTEGDTFTLNVLDEVLTYEVDQIRVVLPYDLSDLRIEPGEDYCTLVTCTPYGINTHRLLVRGHRIATKNVSNVRVTADAMQVEPAVVAIFIAAPVLFLAALAVLIMPKKKRTARS